MSIHTPLKKAGYCYVIGYESGLTKVGRTASPRDRMWSHLYKASKDVNKIRLIYMTNVIADCHTIENLMLDMAGRFFPDRVSRETFFGVDTECFIDSAIRRGISLDEVKDIHETTYVKSLKGLCVFVSTRPVPSTELWFDGDSIIKLTPDGGIAPKEVGE